MKLTAFTDYSLRVLIYLAADPQRRATTADISRAFAISESHLTKVIHFLGRQGSLSTVGGTGGGMALARPPEAIDEGRMVRNREGMLDPAECFSASDSRCAIAASCRFKNALAEAVQAFYRVLDGYSVADIAANRQELAAILHFHPPAAAAVQRRVLESTW